MKENYNTLLRGVIWYWIIVPTAIIAFLTAAGGPGGPLSVAHFMFFIYLQPLFGMTFFLAFINYGLHGFIEFDPKVKICTRTLVTMIFDAEERCFISDVQNRDGCAHSPPTECTWMNLTDIHLSYLSTYTLIECCYTSTLRSCVLR